MSSIPGVTLSASPPLILASASPRRYALLSQLGVPFLTIPADIDERVLPEETPCLYTKRVALAKAQHVAGHYPQAIVLGADSIVVLDRHILGKPHDAADARRMLSSLSGRQHAVLTGLAVLQQARQVVYCEVVKTLVRFRPLSEAMIAQYIATGEPMDKAGAYAIQGAAAAFVAAREGCYTNVIGLPLRRTAALLHLAGLRGLTLPGHTEQTAS